MFEFCVLASGSRANATYVSDGDVRILIDCGLSAKQAALRLTSIGVNPDSIDAIVVSHEHNDHVGGVRVYSKRHKVPVFSNADTLESSKELQQIDADRRRSFHTGECFAIGDLEFESFNVVHDASDPVGFRVSTAGKVLGVLTDLGTVTDLVREQTKGLDAIVLESNHDLQMLRDAPYPWELKQRIGSRSGHLSNDAAGELLYEIAEREHGKLQVAVAAHISENSNSPELAVEAFERVWREMESDRPPQIIAGCVSAPSSLFSLGNDAQYPVSSGPLPLINR